MCALKIPPRSKVNYARNSRWVQRFVNIQRNRTYRILRILLERDSKRVRGIDPTPRHGAEEDPDGTLASASGHSVVVIGRAQQDERVDRHVHHILGGTGALEGALDGSVELTATALWSTIVAWVVTLGPSFGFSPNSLPPGFQYQRRGHW